VDIPVEFRRRPPPPTLEWVAMQIAPGARVTRVRRLRNAWAAAMHAVDVDDGRGETHRLVLRRWARRDVPPDPGVVGNEAAALTALASAPGLRVPRLLAADPDGTAADVPAVVMTRLPGRDVLAPRDLDRFLDGLAAALRAIHAAPVRLDSLFEYRPWNLDRLGGPPRGSGRPDVWRRAIELARRPVPDHPPVLCHRDFHPGNVLWQRDDVEPSGVVDWTHACRGPAAADVAHCRVNLAQLFGLDAANDFARRYGPVDDLAWFDVVAVVGCEPPEVWRWHDAGRTDMTVETIVKSYDDLLADAVERIG